MPQVKEKIKLESSANFTDFELQELGKTIIDKRDQLVKDFIKTMSEFKLAEHEQIKLEAKKRIEFENPKSRVDLIKAQIINDPEVSILQNDVVNKEILYKSNYVKMESIKANQSILQSIIRLRIPDYTDINVTQ